MGGVGGRYSRMGEMVEVARLPFTAVLSSAPGAEPLSMLEVKLNSRIDHSAEDAIIGQLISTARMYIEKITNRALVTQTWQIFYDEFPWDSALALPKGPVQSISHVKYYGTTGSATTWSSANYLLDGDGNPPRLSLQYSKTWPADTLQPIKGVEVQMICGYGDAASVPSPLKQAMFLLCEHWYQNRSEEIMDQPRMQTLPRRLELGVKALIADYIIH